MAAPTFTTDLSTIRDADPIDPPPGWAEAGSPMADGGSPNVDVDYGFIQGTCAVSQTTTKTGFAGMVVSAGSTDITLPTDGAFMIWQQHSNPTAVDTYANSGMMVLIGSATTAYKFWIVGGKDTGRYPFGGWQCWAVDPAVTNDGVVGSPSSTKNYIGAAVKIVTAIGKGEPHAIDVMRFGRCQAIMSGGDSGAPATLAGFAAVNDNTSNRWGLIQKVDGGYLCQGQIGLGISGSVYFIDENTQLLWADTKKAGSNFNLLSIASGATGSQVDFTNMSFLALGTAAKGNFDMRDDNYVNIDACTFTDMGTFTFQSSATIENSTFRRCGLIRQNSAVFTNDTFDSLTHASGSIVNNPGNLSYCSFISDGTGHAMTITQCGEYTFDGNTFAGYGATGTTDAAIFNDSGNQVILNIGGGGDGSPTYTNGTAATTTLCAGLVTLTVDSIVMCSEVRIFAAGTTTELAGVENSDTSFDYSYTYSPATLVDIVCHHVDYEYYRVNDYSLGSTNATFPVAQQVDRQYSNP